MSRAVVGGTLLHGRNMDFGDSLQFNLAEARSQLSTLLSDLDNGAIRSDDDLIVDLREVYWHLVMAWETRHESLKDAAAKADAFDSFGPPPFVGKI